jgi:hypothetical protein
MIAKLEVAAARRPRLYSLRLVALAFLGDVILTFVRVFPLAAPIVIGTLFYNHPVFNWLAVIVVLFLIWLVLRVARQGRDTCRDHTRARTFLAPSRPLRPLALRCPHGLALARGEY